MVLLRYFWPKEAASEIDPHGPLSKHVPSKVISSVNAELKKDKCSSTNSRGEYMKISSKDKAQVAKYASGTKLKPHPHLLHYELFSYGYVRAHFLALGSKPAKIKIFENVVIKMFQ